MFQSLFTRGVDRLSSTLRVLPIATGSSLLTAFPDLHLLHIRVDSMSPADTTMNLLSSITRPSHLRTLILELSLLDPQQLPAVCSLFDQALSNHRGLAFEIELSQALINPREHAVEIEVTQVQIDQVVANFPHLSTKKMLRSVPHKLFWWEKLLFARVRLPLWHNFVGLLTMSSAYRLDVTRIVRTVFVHPSRALLRVTSIFGTGFGERRTRILLSSPGRLCFLAVSGLLSLCPDGKYTKDRSSEFQKATTVFFLATSRIAIFSVAIPRIEWLNIGWSGAKTKGRSAPSTLADASQPRRLIQVW
ncbi:hypothetical protein DFH06DRAFT_1416817 [Mycena polygramma]|nr:hypothetical protein DFH06DRAFT_1416817 [Mycena polygramma]